MSRLEKIREAGLGEDKVWVNLETGQLDYCDLAVAGKVAELLTQTDERD